MGYGQEATINDAPVIIISPLIAFKASFVAGYYGYYGNSDYYPR